MDNKKYFGTDGIRGVANRGHIVPEFILQLGKAAGSFFRKGKLHPRIIIGKDTRLSGYMIESALMSGICAMGADVYFVGPLPTPAISFLVRSMRADAGIVISASHNPYTDNGIKFFGSNGRKLPDEVEAAIEQFMDSGPLDGPDGDGLGKAYRVDDAEGRYIAFAKSTIDEGINFEGLKVVVDCANGAAYEVAPKIFSELGAQVIVIGGNPDGLNINLGCGSTAPEAMVKAVLESGADLGIALDGDGDRAILCDEKGNLVDGDDILFLSSLELQQVGRLANKTAVGTIMTNVGLQSALRKKGITLLRADVGDRYVLEEMTRTGSVLGAEPSGHVIFSDYAPTGDGIVTALQTVGAIVKKGCPLSSLTQGWKRYPQIMVNLRTRDRVPLDGQSWFEELLDNARNELGEDHLLSVRYSGTEPLIRVTVSSESENTTMMVCDSLCDALIERFGWERF
ncbi:MAG: phosphoglucosamine mutase [bacterium]|nr:phosphoglucosamine mutase [bacterium]MDT8366180.1 phosphoglucosamine mutase [bacterium]